MRLSKAEVRQVWEVDRREERKQILAAVVLFAVVFLICMCFRYQAWAYDEKFIPIGHWKSIVTGIRYGLAGWFDPVTYAHRNEAVAQLGEGIYGSAFARLKVTGMAAVAGAGCSMAGAIFQTIYKNPMASPGMLGATAGVRLGNILIITLFSVQALEMVFRRYIYCYVFSAACLAAVILLGKAAGDRRGNPSVMQMIMAGSVISQGLNVFAMYYMYELTDEDLLLYQQLTMGTVLQLDWISMVIFFGAMAVALTPMFLLRYQFNAVGMDFAEAQTIGVDPAPLRMIGQICGVIMITAAMVHGGEAGMIGLVIPYAVRQRVGANTRRVIIFSAAAGGILLMICRLLTSFFVIEDQEIPVGFILNMFLTPAFMVILTKQRRGFEV